MDQNSLHWFMIYYGEIRLPLQTAHQAVAGLITDITHKKQEKTLVCAMNTYLDTRSS